MMSRSWRSEPKARSGANDHTGTSCEKMSSSPYTLGSIRQRALGTAERLTAGASQFSSQNFCTPVS